MRARYDCRKLFWKAFSTSRAQFARFVISGIALLAVIVIIFLLFPTMHAPATHTTPATKFIAGEGPGNGMISFPTPTP